MIAGGSAESGPSRDVPRTFLVYGEDNDAVARLIRLCTEQGIRIIRAYPSDNLHTMDGDSTNRKDVSAVLVYAGKDSQPDITALSALRESNREAHMVLIAEPTVGFPIVDVTRVHELVNQIVPTSAGNLETLVSTLGRFTPHMQRTYPNVYVVTGGSGSGKTEATALVQEVPELLAAVQTFTSRQRRGSDAARKSLFERTNHTILGGDEYAARRRQFTDVFEWTLGSGRYMLSPQEIRNMLGTGKNVLVPINPPDAVEKLRNDLFPGAHIVLLYTTMEEALARMGAEGRTAEEIEFRQQTLTQFGERYPHIAHTIIVTEYAGSPSMERNRSVGIRTVAEKLEALVHWASQHYSPVFPAENIHPTFVRHVEETLTGKPLRKSSVITVPRSAQTAYRDNVQRGIVPLPDPRSRYLGQIEDLSTLRVTEHSGREGVRTIEVYPTVLEGVTEPAQDTSYKVVGAGLLQTMLEQQGIVARVQDTGELRAALTDRRPPKLQNGNYHALLLRVV